MEKKELLKKIKNLADKGIGGEKENAQVLLKRLMLEYNITENDISEDIIKPHEFWFEKQKPFTERLLHQIVYSVIGDINEEKCMREYIKGNKNRIAIVCTDTEYIEIVAKYEFYIYHLAEDMRLFYSAFIQKNGIFPDQSLIKVKDENHKMTDAELKTLMLAGSLDAHKYHKQIEGGNK